MPVLDGSFEAFVTNLGKYNEGELVGEWVHFPTTEEEMKKVFERIGIGSKDEFGQVYEEWFITDYDCSIPVSYTHLDVYKRQSFDCSGFVSYVLTNSGLVNTGRLGAQGLYNVCSPVSSADVKPGDLVFLSLIHI